MRVLRMDIAGLILVRAILVCWGVGCCGMNPVSAEDRRPNVLFIITDDQSYETIRSLGYTDIETPNLDRLADRGTTFTHCYNMGGWGGAVCVSSRTMLITGRSLWRSFAKYKQTDEERQGRRLWPQLMADRGYETYFTGKWHILTDAKQTFHKTGTVREGMPRDARAHYERPVEGEPDRWDPSDRKFGGFWEGGKHWSEVVGDEAVGYLHSERSPEKPFFMYVAFNAPHDPRQSPREYVDRYPLSRVGLPENFLPEYPFKEAMGCTASLRDENLAPFPRTEHAVKVQRGEYYAIITHLDTQVGRILDTLESTGESANTWIFFTSDHGLAVGHHGLFGKQNMYDHSLRVPFLVVGPKVPAGKRIDAPIYLQDVMPTALALGGAKIPDYVEFRSLLPYLAGEGAGEQEVARRDLIYGAYMSQQRAVIHDGWKLIVYPDAPVARLYDLDADPQEMHDLASDPGQGERKRALLLKLQEEQRRLEDGLDLTPILSKL